MSQSVLRSHSGPTLENDRKILRSILFKELRTVVPHYHETVIELLTNVIMQYCEYGWQKHIPENINVPNLDLIKITAAIDNFSMMYKKVMNYHRKRARRKIFGPNEI